jgi:hypothetical protein
MGGSSEYMETDEVLEGGKTAGDAKIVDVWGSMVK